MSHSIDVLDKTNNGNHYCEFCDEQFDDVDELRIDIRDIHSFECNLCEIRLENSEELYMHLLTCEIYRCYTCDYKHKRLSELKSHIKLKHEGRLVTIEHLKMNKENFKTETCTKYSSDDD